HISDASLPIKAPPAPLIRIPSRPFGYIPDIYLDILRQSQILLEVEGQLERIEERLDALTSSVTVARLEMAQFLAKNNTEDSRPADLDKENPGSEELCITFMGQ
ncbi:hypothetical protein FOZ63_026282, partial [Perkinsus olseni]